MYVDSANSFYISFALISILQFFRALRYCAIALLFRLLAIRAKVLINARESNFGVGDILYNKTKCHYFIINGIYCKLNVEIIDYRELSRDPVRVGWHIHLRRLFGASERDLAGLRVDLSIL